MEIKSTTDKIVKILLNPPLGWKKAEFSGLKFGNVIFPYLTGILVLCFLSRVIGKSLSYLSISSIQHIMFYSLFSLFVDYLFFISLVLSINALLPYNDSKADKTKVGFLLLISLLPFYASIIILNLLPSLFFLAIISFYSLFILYWGISKYLKINEKRQVIFFTLTSIIIIGIWLILHFIIIYPFFEFFI
ncbi:MAG: hypothetical protein C0596_07325 [Marinilabiliales bacterium]|nr:MAG: hypothetical protein C0596_07325 [Marinilabiliales bacterium]